MGKTIDEKRSSTEFKELLLPEEKRNYVLCSSNSSSIKSSSNSSSSSISISTSPTSTTSHLSEYSSSEKPIEIRSCDQSKNDEQSNQESVKENKLNREKYVLLLNNIDQSKNYHSSPSTKSSSINSLNHLIKSSPSIGSTNLPKQINRSLTFIDQNSLDKCKFTNCSKPIQQTKQYFNKSNDKRLAKSASIQNQNLATYQSNLPQSYSAVFNDKCTADRQYVSYDNQSIHSNNNPNSSQLITQCDNQLKIGFKDAFYKKWFLNKFRSDNEFNFESGMKNKKPKLINLKRYSSIELNKENLEKSNQQSNSTEKSNDLIPGPSGLQMMKRNNDKNHLRSDLKIQLITNPLHPFYLNDMNCTDIDTWAVDASNTITIDHQIDESPHLLSNSNNYPTLVCSTNYESKNSADNKQNNQHSELQSNSNIKNSNKKPILLPKLHNEYCINTNSSHHHHHKNHYAENNNSNGSTTRSSSTNSSNVSTSSSTNDNKPNSNLKPANNELSGSLSSVSSVSSVNTDPMRPICKICHLNGKEEDPLITPCKCSGTMQYIHCKCLMRWLEISKKKSRKPLRCELCQYEYEWKKKFKVGNWQFPKCSKRDIILHVAFCIAMIIMICCALSMIFFYKLQEPPRMGLSRSEMTLHEPLVVVFAMVFVFSFCLSLYAQVKARTTLYRLIANFIYLNQNWYINEYEGKKSSSAKEVSEIV